MATDLTFNVATFCFGKGRAQNGYSVTYAQSKPTEPIVATVFRYGQDMGHFEVAPTHVSMEGSTQLIEQVMEKINGNQTQA